jgi:hypothetical protein
MVEQNLEKYIVLIPNAIDPYGYEIVNILAYPNGFTYRFRFDQQWVHNKVQHNIPNLINKQGYIVLRDRDSALLYPIRKCTIKRADRIGITYYFEYELGDIIDYDSQENLRINQIKKFNEEFTASHAKDISNKAGEDMTPLCLLSNYEPAIQNQSSSLEEREFEQWGNVIEAIKDIKLYEDVEFIKLVDILSKKPKFLGSYIKSEKFKRFIKTGPDKASVQNNSFIFKENLDYEIRVYQYIPNRKKESVTRDIKMVVDDKYISPIRGQQRAVGKYDVITFLLRTNPHSGGRRSFIDIEHVTKAEAAPSIEPKIYFPVFIRKSRKKSLLFFCATVLLFLAYNLAHYLSHFVHLEP